jgi:hypothetical protein
MGENCCRNTAGQCNGAGEDLVCTKHIWYTFTGISVKFATTKGGIFGGQISRSRTGLHKP